MVAHESRKKKNKNQVQYAWFMSSNVIPPNDVPTDDEFTDVAGQDVFRGKRVVRRKIRNTRDAETVLSKYRNLTDIVIGNNFNFKVLGRP